MEIDSKVKKEVAQRNTITDGRNSCRSLSEVFRRNFLQFLIKYISVFVDMLSSISLRAIHQM